VVHEVSIKVAKPLTGFAKLKAENPAALEEICSAAGKRAHAIGHACTFDSERAKAMREKQKQLFQWRQKHKADQNPCRGDKRCFNTGRCPFAIVCNN
jgi:TPP-dependent indolepyruvate ferredoxin oxidoreductase alpha subunit